MWNTYIPTCTSSHIWISTHCYSDYIYMQYSYMYEECGTHAYQHVHLAIYGYQHIAIVTTYTCSIAICMKNVEHIHTNM